MSDKSTLLTGGNLDADALVPAHLVRPYPFPEDRNIALALAGGMARYPALWGILGGGIYLGYAFLGGGMAELRSGDFSQAMPMMWKFVGSTFLPVLTAAAVDCGLERLTGALYRENEGFIQYPEAEVRGKPTLEQRMESKKLDVTGQMQWLFFQKEKARETLISAAQANPYNISSRISLVEISAIRFGQGKDTFESLVERCYEAARCVGTMDDGERKLQRRVRPSVWSSLRTEWSLKSLARPRDIVPKMVLLSVNHASGRHRSVIEGVDDIVRTSRKEAMKKIDLGGEGETAETAGLYGCLATLMRSVSAESKRNSGRARARERWLWEQVYLMAAGEQAHYLGESKNKVMMIGTPSIRQEIIVKEYASREAAEGEVTLTGRINEAIAGRREYLVPEPIASFTVTHRRKKKEVAIWRMLPGKTFYDKIREGDPDIMRDKDKALGLIGLIHREVSHEEFGLSERDYPKYVMDWAAKAEVEAVFRNGELKGHYLPILESFREAKKVLSLDPHAMNLFVTDDGRIAKIDNELTRSIPVQGDLVRFLELFPYDPSRKQWPGTPDHKGFMEDLAAYEEGSGKLTKDDGFYIGYLNAVVDQSLSLYSPYSVRMEMAPLKKDLLYKCRNALDIIASDFQTFHERYREQYAGLRRVMERMIERNGFR